MESSVRALIDDARKIAASRGLTLPLAKARNALSLCLYGAPYSAVMAAEKAGKETEPNPDPARANLAAKTYRCDARLVLEAAQAAFAILQAQDDNQEGDDDDLDGNAAYLDEESPELARGLMAAIKRIVMGVERERKRGGLTWADYGSVDDVHDAFGSDDTLKFDDAVGEFTALVDRAIDTDGRSLPEQLRAIEAYCRKSLGDSSDLDTAWIGEIEATYQAASRRPPKARQPERFAINLLIGPNFDAIERRVITGQMQAPRVNMHEVDYNGLAEYLGQCFNFRNSRLRVPNDMLDQTTLHMRAMGMAQGDPEGQDFLRLLVAEAAKQTDTVIDVRSAWRPLQRLKDRTFAPPPCALTMVVETHDWEDAAQVLMYMRMKVGITAGTPQGMMDPTHATVEGRLGPPFLKYLEKMFGIAFRPEVAFTNPCHERVPRWAKP